MSTNNDRRNQQIKTRLSGDESGMVDVLCQREGISRSEWCRNAVGEKIAGDLERHARSFRERHEGAAA